MLFDFVTYDDSSPKVTEIDGLVLVGDEDLKQGGVDQIASIERYQE